MDGELPDSFWLEATLELLRRCDLVVMMENWEESTGARGEHDEAIRRGIRVVYEPTLRARGGVKV